jgi:hypothetical protein
MLLVKLMTAHLLAFRLQLVVDVLNMFKMRVCSFSKMMPIGAAFGVPSTLYVETMVSANMPFKKPKSVNFAIKPTQTMLEGHMHLFSTECKNIQSNNKVLPNNNMSQINNPHINAQWKVFKQLNNYSI